MEFENLARIWELFCKDRFIKVKIDDEFGILSKKGKWLIEPKFRQIKIKFESEKIKKPRKNNLNKICIFKNKRDKFGLIDKNGKIITRAIYDEIRKIPCRKRYFKVKKNYKFGIIDAENNTILAPIYDEIDERYCCAKMENRRALYYGNYRYFNSINKIYIFDDGVYLEIIEGEIVAIKDNKTLFRPIHLDDKILKKFISFDFNYREPEYLIVRDNCDFMGILSTENGDWILEPKFQKIEIKNNLAHLITIDDKNGIFDLKNFSYLLPPIDVQKMELLEKKIAIKTYANSDEIVKIEISL